MTVTKTGTAKGAKLAEKKFSACSGGLCLGSETMTVTKTGNAARTKVANRSLINVLRGLTVLCGFCLLSVMIFSQSAAPVIVVETSKGTFEFETYPVEAPKTVAHVVDLVKRRFYDGQRLHRALPGFLVQWGDPR